MKRVLLMTLPLLLLSETTLANIGGGAHSMGLWKILFCVGWWLVASTLLFFTWNKIIVFLTGLKEVKLWQALLFVATIAILCYPRKCNRYHHKMKMNWKKPAHHTP